MHCIAPLLPLSPIETSLEVWGVETIIPEIFMGVVIPVLVPVLVVVVVAIGLYHPPPLLPLIAGGKENFANASMID